MSKIPRVKTDKALLVCTWRTCSAVTQENGNSIIQHSAILLLIFPLLSFSFPFLPLLFSSPFFIFSSFEHQQTIRHFFHLPFFFLLDFVVFIFFANINPLSFTSSILSFSSLEIIPKLILHFLEFLHLHLFLQISKHYLIPHLLCVINIEQRVHYVMDYAVESGAQTTARYHRRPNGRGLEVKLRSWS